MVLIFNPQLTDLCWERHLDATLQDVVSGDLHRAGQLQVLHHQIGGHLREHLLDLMGLMNRGYIKSEERNGLEKSRTYPMEVKTRAVCWFLNIALVISKYKTFKVLQNLFVHLLYISANSDV